nr:class I SAM-dependent methyltransferase [candidate division Zixibacteria bacterium]
MPTLEQKKEYFNQYWQEQPETKTDPRSHQRAEIVSRMLNAKSGKLLDFGCGRGVTLAHFADKGYDVFGAEISPEMVKKVRESGYRIFEHDIESAELDDRYDIILCLEVLQQLHDPVGALRKMKKALTTGGELVVSVPNEFHLIARLRLIIGLSHLGHFHHSHIRLFSSRRDRELFAESGLKITGRRYIPIIPPRWKILSAVFTPLAQWWPGLFAISSIYNLEDS